MGAPNNSPNNDWTSWIPIVILFCVPYTWPIALIMLIRKLTGADKRRRSRHPYDIQQEQARRQAGAGWDQSAGQAQTDWSQTTGQTGTDWDQTARQAGEQFRRQAEQFGQEVRRQAEQFGEEVRQWAGQARQTGGQTGQTAGQTRQTAGQTGQASGQARQTAGQTRQTTGQTGQAAGQTRQTAGQARQTSGQTHQAAGQQPGAGAKRSSAGQADRKRAGKGPKVPGGKGLTIAGAIVSGIFGLGFVSELIDALSWGGVRYELSGLVALLAFLCLGLVLLFCGLGRTRKGKRLRKYLGLIGNRRSVSLTALSKTSGVRRRKMLDDLQDLLDTGLLPTGYLDLAHDRLVLSEEGVPDEEPEERSQAGQAPEPEPAQDDNAILAEIRAVNDAIPDPVMSAKIDRIEEITGKILDYQRRNPGKDGQLRSFLNYYLPTTLKILHSYAQLDAQGVEGENISATKARIEGMMDKVVEGFETQLDKLFEDSALDISSDVAVLEQMLEKDGLSGGRGGMTLGG